MATLASLGGNFTTAGSWALCDATSALDSEASSAAGSTGTQDSNTFIPAAVAIDAVGIKIASRASGTPSNTISMILRNSTTATNIATVTINVADLDVCTTSDHAGGWYFFKLGATHTPNGTDSYVIRITMSATTTAVSLWVSAGTNWARLLRTTTTQAPAAGDKLVIGGEFTGAGTGTNISITMNNTATTTFGAVVSTSTFLATLSIGKRGTLTWATSSATNYVLRMSGFLVVHSGGVMQQYSSGSPCPIDSTAVIEFTPTSSADSGILILNGATWTSEGNPARTAGKSFDRTLLTADAAAAATSLTIATDTGWLNGDEIGIAPTKRTSSQYELRTLNANAGASSLSISSGLTNAHDGSATNGIQAEIILLTRSVKIRSTSTSLAAYLWTSATAVTLLEWVEFRYCGGNVQTRSTGSVTIGTTTGTLTVNRCAIRDPIYAAFDSDSGISTSNNFTITNNVVYGGTATFGFRIANAQTTSNWSFTNNIILGTSTGFQSASMRGTITGNTVAGAATRGFDWTDSTSPIVLGSFDNNTAHSNNEGIYLNSVIDGGQSLTGLTAWRNGVSGITLNVSANHYVGLQLINPLIFGNATAGIYLSLSNQIAMLIKGGVFAGDSSFGQPAGVLCSTGVLIDIRLETCTFGVASGIKVAHSTGDFDFNSVKRLVRLSFWNCNIASSTRFANTTNLVDGSYFAETKKNQTAGSHQKQLLKRGTVAIDTSTVHTSTASQKLTPSTATGLKLQSGPKRAQVGNGNTVTFSAWVRKDGSYAGAAARLVLRANPALGITSDTVLATAAAAANTWEQLSGTSASVTDNGVLEAYVDCDGSAGNVYVTDEAVS